MKDNYEIVNALITSATLSSEDYGVLSGWVQLDYGGSCQGFGGYSLYLPKSFDHHNIMSVAGHFIFRCMEIAGVYNWKDIPGKSIRVAKEKGFNGLIKGIGHIIKDDWFFPETDFAEIN